ncbi:MAG: D-alanine--D-alanine ligase [Alphaproteobacteria bacterium]|nr:MAG: D-alanine--D-alanine ligase [Alphaproteobacteria bacterium]
MTAQRETLPLHVAVLMGGPSAEREVSLVSGAACAAALGKLGHRVTEIDVTRDIAATLKVLTALDPHPDVVFNALHGRYGEDGCIQGMLEFLAIPYTHSGVLASALAMDKPTARRLFTAAGLTCAEGRTARRDDVIQGRVMDPPYVVKPLNQGSSVGVHIVLEGDGVQPLASDWPFGERVLVERYIPGREIQVAVMDDQALGAIEIRPKGQFYDYRAKYTEGQAEHLMPAPLSDAEYAEALEVARLAHATLGCQGVTRTDLRFDDTGDGPGHFYVLEVNTQPGMTPLSLVPEIAAHAGIGFGQLVAWMVEDASCPR